MARYKDELLLRHAAGSSVPGRSSIIHSSTGLARLSIIRLGAVVGCVALPVMSHAQEPPSATEPAVPTAADSNSAGDKERETPKAEEVRVGQRMRTVRDTAMRELPRRKAGLVAMLAAGTEMEVIQTGKWWINVKTPNHNGYVPLVNLETVEGGEVEVAPTTGSDTGAGDEQISPELRRARQVAERAEQRWKAAEVRARKAESRVLELEAVEAGLRAKTGELESQLRTAGASSEAAPTDAAAAQRIASLEAEVATLQAEAKVIQGALAKAKESEAKALTTAQEASSMLSEAEARGKSLDQLEADLKRRAALLEERAVRIADRESAIESKWKSLGGDAAGDFPVDDAGAETAQMTSPASGLPITEEEVPTEGPEMGAAIRIVIYELAATDLEQRHLDLISTSLLAEVRKLQRVSAIGMDEVKALLSMEEQKQMVGCEDEESCLTEIAGALGADYLVMGAVGQVGDSRVMAIKRVNMVNAKLTQSFDRRMTGGGGEELLDSIGQAVTELFPEYPIRAGFTRGVNEEVVARWNPPPLDPWVFWSLNGASVVSITTAAVLWQRSSAAVTQYERINKSSLQDPVSGDKLMGKRNSADRLALAGNVMAGLCLTFAITSGVVSLFTDWEEDFLFGTEVSVGVAAGGPTGASIRGSF